MQDQNLVDQAIGMLVAALRISTPTASDRLSQAATRAGISEAQAAQTMIRAFSG
jgi:hypothetical protein